MSNAPTSLATEASFGKIVTTSVLRRSSLLIRSIWFDVDNLRSAVSRVATVLRGDLAEQQSKMLIRLFKGMKDFITDAVIFFKRTNGIFHDRYIIVDFGTENEIIYHCGASSKDAGNKISSIMLSDEHELYKPLIENLLKNQSLAL